MWCQYHYYLGSQEITIRNCKPQERLWRSWNTITVHCFRKDFLLRLVKVDWGLKQAPTCHDANFKPGAKSAQVQSCFFVLEEKTRFSEINQRVWQIRCDAKDKRLRKGETGVWDYLPALKSIWCGTELTTGWEQLHDIGVTDYTVAFVAILFAV